MRGWAGPAPGWGRRVAVFTPLGVYGFVYPFGLGLSLLGWLPAGAAWVGGVLLAAQGLAVAAWLALNFGARHGLLGAAGVGIGAWLLEAGGVVTGLPFGAYQYSPALGAALGPVPAAIPCAWIAALGAALFTARALLPPRWATPGPVALLGAALATLQDAVLEPIATRVQGYWTWTAPDGAYYGVPWTNFAAWFGAALGIGGLLLALLRLAPGAHLRYTWLPPLLYAMSLLMFGMLNWSRGFLAPALLATLLLPALIWRLYQCARPL